MSYLYCHSSPQVLIFEVDKDTSESLKNRSCKQVTALKFIVSITSLPEVFIIE